MKLGLKEIGTVVALATAGCAIDKPTTAISRRQYDAFPDTITEKTIADIRKSCAKVGDDEGRRVFREFADCGVSLSGVINIANSAGEKAKKDCLALHGLNEAEQQ